MKRSSIVAGAVVLSGMTFSPSEAGPLLNNMEFELTISGRPTPVYAEFGPSTAAWVVDASPILPNWFYLESVLTPNLVLVFTSGQTVITTGSNPFDILNWQFVNGGALALGWSDGTRSYLTGLGWTLPFGTNQQLYFFSGRQILPPPNDAFAQRIALSGLPVTTSGTTAGSTTEIGEPAHAGVPSSDSVWWSWTAPQSGRVSIDTFGSPEDTQLAVYTGSALGSLVEVTSNDDASDGSSREQSLVRFSARAGTTYQLAVGTSQIIQPRDIQLHIVAAPPGPANDDFADSIAISGLPVVMEVGTTVNASAEAGEPAHDDNVPAHASIWWNWTAQQSGRVEVETFGSTLDTVLGVYIGPRVDALTHVPVVGQSDEACFAEHSALQFNAQAGTTYHIAVDGDTGKEGAVVLNLRAPAIPPNDDFANRETLIGFPAEVQVRADSLSSEPSEPLMNGFPPVRTMWWRWTSPISGDVVIDVLDSEVSPLAYINAFTGTDLATLTGVDGATGVEPVIRFTASAGTTYQLRTSSPAGQPCDDTPFDAGQVVLRIQGPPANDNFANRIPLAGLPTMGSGSNIGATAEPGEPNHLNRITEASLWWSWTSPVNGSITVEAQSPERFTEVAVYSGADLQGLQPVAEDDDLVTFTATAGTTYQIAIDPGTQAILRGTVEILIMQTP